MICDKKLFLSTLFLLVLSMQTKTMEPEEDGRLVVFDAPAYINHLPNEILAECMKKTIALSEPKKQQKQVYNLALVNRRFCNLVEAYDFTRYCLDFDLRTPFGYRKAEKVNGEIIALSSNNANKDEIIKRLENPYTCINFKNKKGNTPLCMACFYEADELVTMYVEKYKADVNKKYDLFAPLCYAFEGASMAFSDKPLSCVMTLVKAGAYLHDMVDGECTPLGRAVQPRMQFVGHDGITSHGAQKKLVQLIIEKRAEVNQRQLQQRTALHTALSFKVSGNSLNQGVIETLMQVGANPHMKHEFGMTPYEMAEYHEQQHNNPIPLQVIKAYDKGINNYPQQ